MLRTNLSTRPFYNERAVHFALILAAAVVVAMTFVNVVWLIQLSSHNTELSSRMSQERAEAERLTREAATIRRGIDQKELQLVVAAAREANTLIDQRTFSWTSFFNRIEATIPADVMLRSVRPSIDNGVTRVEMVLLARRSEDVEAFATSLETTKAFEQVNVRQQSETDEGLLQANVDAIYTPPVETGPPAAAAPADAKPAPKAADDPKTAVRR